MTAIKILPSHLANKIAAGEVVERPASVVKELLENALDAGADMISIEIENGGLDKIRISDNGIGMSAKDAKLSFERHATSKISCEADLYSIATLGFRGEAIASIASVSMMNLQTRQKGHLEGQAIETIGGEVKSEGATGCPEGTIFEVNNLFFNTPARKKFLKTITTEFGHISSMVLQAALGFYERGFKLIHNGSVHYDLPRGQSLNERIYSLLGKEVYDNLIPIEEVGEDIAVRGFLVAPSVTRNSRKHQYLFVNQRSIQSAVISRAVQDSYHALMPHGRYPLFIFNLEINPLEVDVNIHPRKLEVRFLHQQDIYRFVKKACKSVLESHDLSPKISLDSLAATPPPFRRDHNPVAGASTSRPMTYGTSNFTSGGSAMPPAQLFSAPPSDRAQMPSENPVAVMNVAEDTKLKPVAQINNSYIVAHDEDGIVLMDQHAAHERVNYMKLMAAFEDQLKDGLAKQQLLTPISIDLNLQQAAVLTENLETFAKLGFEIEHFGGNSFLIRSVPACLSKVDFSEIFQSILDDLVAGNIPDEVQKKREYIINFIACRSSIKFGRPLERSEQVQLIKDMEELSQKYTCPHGRPTMIRFTYKELEKKFGRL